MSHAVASHSVPFGRSSVPRDPVVGAPVVEISRAGTVAADLACRKCSANLRGLLVTTQCRQCGTRVGVSLYGELLKYGHPRWVRGLSAGAVFCSYGAMLGVAGAIAGATVGGAVGQWLGPAVATVAAGMYLQGVWRLTAGDGVEQVEVAPLTSRLLMRLLLCAWVVPQVIPLVVVAAPQLPARLLNFAALAAAFVGVVGHVAMLDYMHRLALRVPAAALARKVLVVRWGYCGALALTTLCAYLPSAVATTRTAAYASIFALVALLVYSAIFTMILHRLGRAFSIQADYAHGICSRAAAAIG